MDPDLERNTSTAAERRRGHRQPASGEAIVRIAAQELRGSLRDLSRGGSFLTLSGALVMTLTYEQDGREQSRRVRLVRAQQVAADRSGWAVEFLPDDRPTCEPGDGAGVEGL